LPCFLQGNLILTAQKRAALSSTLCFSMTYRKLKLISWTAFLVLPLGYHIFQVYKYAYGHYDGKHCAGLLDAVWECTELEYYLDWMFNPFTIVSLLGSYLVALPIALIVIYFGKRYFKRIEMDSKT